GEKNCNLVVESGAGKDRIAEHACGIIGSALERRRHGYKR
ncbi:unnamed protein product, partial [marine sediment metagenome]